MARTGRPRMFDKDHAVQQAMMLFWTHGYEATSLSSLKSAMGDISAPSFYAAFGSKALLFREVLAQYLASFGQVSASLRDASLPPRKAIELTLRHSAKMQTDVSHPSGCLLVLATATCTQESQELHDALADERRLNSSAMLSCVQRAIRNKELPKATDAVALATMFDCFYLGMTIKARDGATFSELDRAVDQIMGVWDALAAAAAVSTKKKVRSAGRG
jgi:AcrR family transcriptional regulator